MLIYIHLRTELFDTACEHDSILNQDPLDQFINIMMNYQKHLVSVHQKSYAN